MASWGGPYNQLRKRKFRPGLLMVLHDLQTPPETEQLQHYSPSLGHPWRTVVKGIPVGRTVSSAPGLVVHFTWKEKWPDVWLYADSGAGASGLAGWSGTWKEDDWKIHDEEVWGRDLQTGFSEWAISVRYPMSMLTAMFWLFVSRPKKFIYWNPSPQGDGIRRWGLWKGIRS